MTHDADDGDDDERVTFAHGSPYRRLRQPNCRAGQATVVIAHHPATEASAARSRLIVL